MRPGVVLRPGRRTARRAVEGRLTDRIGRDRGRIVEDRRLVEADLSSVEGPAVASTEGRPAVTEDVPGKAKARCEVGLLRVAHLVAVRRCLIVIGGVEGR